MKIEAEPGRSLNEVFLYLSLAEADELRDALNDMRDRDNQHRDWHSHVMSSDGKVEITVAWDQDRESDRLS